jgi:2-polyprenyl-3-methyl-5-hydroxy-6-metoxy-1,4-benzoquinol methylase
VFFPLGRHYFVRPPSVNLEGYRYMPDRGAETYSGYNYLSPGIAARLRTQHFEWALRLTHEHFHQCNVIDFGCADGPFIPSLARYFNSVVGIDQHPSFSEIASRVVQRIGLTNATVLCNKGLTIDEMKARMPEGAFKILFLLETLEHVGQKVDPWTSRVKFLQDLSQLITPDGLMVVSVPNMVGLSFLMQRVGLAIVGASRERISSHQILKASILSDTSDLEKQWVGGHLGFNHKRLENRIAESFHIVKKKGILWQVIYVLSRKAVK